ncbi:MAG: squalene/phytoene synthase family protein [Pseudomonadota bacterium]
MKPEFIEPVFEGAKSHARDRYLSALLCPGHERDDLLALAAVVGEIERIPALVSEPMLGEIRLQWWADWVQNLEDNPGATTGNPIADALGDVIRERGLPIAPMRELCEARISDLYADPFETTEAYAQYLSACETGPYQLAAAICGQTQTDASHAAKQAIANAGRATGGMRVLMKLAFFAARGRWPLPIENQIDPLANAADNQSVRQTLIRDEMQHVRKAACDATNAIKAADAEERTPLRRALRPIALIETYLTLLETQESWSLRPMKDLSPLSRVWILGKARVLSQP